jgi:hypothetical protein
MKHEANPDFPVGTVCELRDEPNYGEVIVCEWDIFYEEFKDAIEKSMDKEGWYKYIPVRMQDGNISGYYPDKIRIIQKAETTVEKETIEI